MRGNSVYQLPATSPTTFCNQEKENWSFQTDTFLKKHNPQTRTKKAQVDIFLI